MTRALEYHGEEGLQFSIEKMKRRGGGEAGRWGGRQGECPRSVCKGPVPGRAKACGQCRATRRERGVRPWEGGLAG